MENNIRSVSGIVFNIQHYSIHDGPGIRTNVFVKGCPLNCAWCANPESKQPKPQLMYLASKCVGCGQCVSVCPNGAIIRRSDNPALVNTDRTLCTACGACIDVCSPKAREITGREMTVGEAFDEVANDVLFYADDGGLTVTGGEALAQPGFTGALVKLCRDAGISTALETCGAVGWDIMAPVLENTDIVLYDIKQMDSELHKKYTGLGNEKILENLINISAKTECTIIVRCPVIPGCNDSEENMHALGRFLVENNIRCSEINLLPYHNMGESKLEQLEPNAESFTSHTPTENELENLRSILRGYGFIVK